MVKHYHNDIVFEDPAFGKLQGDRAKNMWLMLCNSQKGKDFKITFNNVQSADNTAKANWEAFYTFSKTGRKVHNTIKAQFVFKDCKIIEHTDSFSLHKWASQALGFKGYALGLLPFFKSKLQVQTNKLLQNFEKTL